MSAYQPELGQMVFGNPTQALKLPVEVECALDAIQNAIGTMHPKLDNPFSNSGARYRWSCFQVHAYDWGAAFDDDAPGQPWNFKWRDFEVSWYKYWSRGASRNRKISASELKELLRECLTAVLTEEPQEDYDA